MKRELFAAALLLALFLGAWLNIRAVDKLSNELIQSVDESEEAYNAGDTVRATAAMEQALLRWIDADSYTHIFIRHSEIDSTSDAFYELQQALHDSILDPDSDCSAAYGKLRYHIRSIQQMEHPRLGSIL
jgi:hypothetical protein